MGREDKVGKKELLIKSPEPEIVFSFKYFNAEQAAKGVGQHFRDWESDTQASRTIKDIRNLVEKYSQKTNEIKELFFMDFLQNIQKVLDDYMQSGSNHGLLSDFFEKLIDLSSKTRSAAISKNRTDKRPIGVM